MDEESDRRGPRLTTRLPQYAFREIDSRHNGTGCGRTKIQHSQPVDIPDRIPHERLFQGW
jgi:hypothetical protein